MDDKFTLHNSIALVICMQKNYQIWWRFDKVLTKQAGSFFGTPCTHTHINHGKSNLSVWSVSLMPTDVKMQLNIPKSFLRKALQYLPSFGQLVISAINTTNISYTSSFTI